MERETQSARSTLVRQQQNNEILKLQEEIKRLKETIIGLGAIVAEAQNVGFVRVKEPQSEKSAYSDRNSND